MWTTRLESLFSGLAPQRCAGCGATGFCLCRACVDELRALPLPPEAAPGGLRVRSSFAYMPLVRRILHHSKYRDHRSALRVLSVIAASRLQAAGGRFRGETVVPVPLGRRRQGYRGYNQAETWGRAVAEVTGLELSLPLVRRRETSSQTRLPRSRRAANVEGAFAGAAAVPMRLYLVDDIVTTGSTLSAAAAALRAAGAREIEVWTIAATIAAAGKLR